MKSIMTTLGLSLAAMTVSEAASSVTVFHADFESSPAETTSGGTSLFNSNATVRNTILDAGTSTGTWDDNDSGVNLTYEISGTVGGSNNVLLFSSISNSITLADAAFNQTVNLTGNELTVSWDWMHTDEGGGGSGIGYIQLLDSSNAVVATVQWQDGGALNVAGTGLGNFKYELLGRESTELSTSNWDPLSMQLAVTSSGIAVTTSGSNHAETTHATIAGSFSEVAGLRLRSSSNKSWSEGGLWIDNINAEYSAVAVPEPTSTALLGLAGLALILRRRK